MEVDGSAEKIYDPSLPLSSLRLLVPPLQLLYAAMWQLAKQKDVMNYERLQEFVFTVTEAVPGLINHRQRAQLILGLRARLILELCKDSARGSVDSQMVQSYLDRLPITSSNTDYRDAEVKTTESIFIALVQSLLKDPVERAYFFQEVFPVEYGPKYDAALHVLLWELLSKLEKVLPVPDLKQTAAWLGSAPPVLEECVQSSPEEQLSLIFELYKTSGLLKMPHGPSSTIGSCIISALSIPPSQKTNISVGLESIHSYANVLDPVALVGTDQYSIVAVYTDIEDGEREVYEETMKSAEVQLQTDFYEEEIVAVGADSGVAEEAAVSRPEETGDAADVAKALETLTKTFALRKENLCQDVVTGKCRDSSPNDELGSGIALDGGETRDGYETRDHGDETRGNIVEEVLEDFQPGDLESIMDSCADLNDNRESISEREETSDVSEALNRSVCSTNVRRSSRLQTKSSPSRLSEEPKTFNNNNNNNISVSRNKTDVSAAPPVMIAVKGKDNDDSGEMASIIFTCSKCPFHDADESSPPHFHMQSVRTEVYRTLSGAKLTPSPSGTDEIFTSIKLYSKGNPEEPSVTEPPGNQGGDAHASQSHGKPRALTCETCGKTFTRTSDVRRHQLTHTGERPFHCSQCEWTFQHSWDLAKHRSKHHGLDVSFACQLCWSAFANLRALTAHHKSSHGQESRLPQICSICSQRFSASSDLTEHRKSHVTSRRYICHQCGEGFDSLLARSQHRQVHQATRQFKCARCEKTFTRRSDVKRHQSTHTGERPHQCDQCSKRFSLRFMLMKHLRVHTGERPFQCSHCPKRFTLVSVLARHERMHTGEKPFLCSQCGKGFLSQGELSKHYRSHVDDKPYSCTQCDKRFKSKKTQREHIASHSGARPYPCTHCGKGFTKPYALTRHNLIHTGERPFPCGHCPKSFLTLGEAQLHRRIHTGERPYPCGACELRFKSSSELARHRRGHSRSKPRCGQCMETFASKAKLKKHIMEKHGEEGEAAQTEANI